MKKNVIREYFPSLRRFMFIDKKIRSEKFPNQKYLCNSFLEEEGISVSIRTIGRDIEKMKLELNAPIEYHSSKKGYYYSSKDFQIPFFSLLENEIFALFFAEKSLQIYENTPIYKDLLFAFNKIKNQFKDLQNISWIQSSFTFKDKLSANIKDNVWENILVVIKEKKVVLIEYQKPNQNSYQVVIHPYHIISDKGQFYIIGFVNSLNDLRIYNLTRIKEVKILDEYFEILESFNAHEFLKFRFGFQPDNVSYKFKIEFLKEAAPLIKEKEWWPGQVIIEKPNHSIELEFYHNSPFEVKLWVLQWDYRAIVREPDFFKNEVKETLLKTLENYH